MTISKVKIGTTEHDLAATKLTTSRLIALSGSVSGSAYFDGNADVNIATSISDAYATKEYADSCEDAAKSYADSKISDLVDSAPETLNTLDKLAAALKDNPQVVDALNAGVATKVDKAGDTMTGALIVDDTIRAKYFKGDNTEAAIKPQGSNEINFGSNANYIYFAYQNGVSSPGVVDTFNFGRSNGSAGARDGDIYCGSVTANRTIKGESVTVANTVTIQYNPTFECLNFSFS